MPRSGRFHEGRQRRRRSAEDGQRRDHPKDERSSVNVNHSRELRELLSGIGAPPPTPFKPDAFQLEALAALEFEDVLVTAPTGSGKTWIAREEIRRLLDSGKRAWYTTPLKALTNSKYQEFGDEFGGEATITVY